MNNPYQNPQPPLGATFYPGREDDFYMPEVISPAPQRIMPEVPENMQNNVNHFEQQAQRPPQHQSSTPVQYDGNNQYPRHQHSQSDLGHAQYQGGHNGQPNFGNAPAFEAVDQPNFSRFPLLRNPPPNVPPTADQKEATLANARVPVLGSNDPFNQLEWAQDALANVDETVMNEQRIHGIPESAVKLSKVQTELKTDALNVIRFLADQEHPRALVLKGTWLEYGKFGYNIDKPQAWQCYSSAVKNTNSLPPHDPAKKWGGRAQYRIGMQFENSKEIINALKYYQMAADVGDSAACYRLGMMVLLGQQGQVQDYQRGLKYIETAAQNADENAPQGAYVLGMLQAHELPQVTIPDFFLPQDLNKARVNIERAAFLGFAKAQVKMGSAYETGELGCAFNPTLSLHYNNLAARQGEVEAEMAISKWFLAGHEGVFEKDEEMAFTYAQRAAADGLATAQFAMGYFHEIGIYVPVNLQVAKEWYGKAASSGNSDAASRIDGLSRSKTLSRRDHDRIAVTRIKESRLQSPTEPVPPLPGQVNMPDPARMSLQSPVNGPDYNGGQRRHSNAAPYPAGNDFGPSSAPPRPGMLGHSSTASVPEARPGSAFGINPNLRPASAAAGAGGQPDLYARRGIQDQRRTHSTYDVPGPGYGRGGTIPSGPPSQGYPGRGPGGPPFHPAGPGQPPSKLDIGFLAPLDSSGRPAPNRLQKVNNNNPGAGRPLQNFSPGAQQNPKFPKISHSPHMQGPSMGNGPVPPRQDSRPQKPLPQPGRPPQAAPVPSPGPPPQKQPPQKQPPSFVKPAAVTRPPGKGPKTFDEMGVPAGKGKEDCIMM